MTTKEYLLQVQKSRNAIRQYEDEIERLRNQAAGIKAITYDKDRVQTSPDDYMLKMITKLIDMEKEYADTLQHHYELIQRITEQVNSLPDINHVEILRQRYLIPYRNGYQPTPFKVIARRIHRSEDYCWHQHGEALRAFQKQYAWQ